MSEKTPRQVSKEAAELYEKHGDIQDELAHEADRIQYFTRQMQFHDSMVRAHKASPRRKRVSNVYGRTNHAGLDSNEQAFADDNRDLTRAIVSQGIKKEQDYINLQEAAEHYEQNAAAYHMAAIGEAALDGMQINVSQSQESPEKIEVRVQK